MLKLREHVGLLARFGSVGLLNTAISLSVMMGLEMSLGTAPALANLAGYAVGLMSGFLLSRRFVFRSIANPRATIPRYLLTVAGGFCLNQLVLAAALTVLGAGSLQHMAAQLCGMASYTLSTFFICRFWVFRTPIDPVIATA